VGQQANPQIHEAFLMEDFNVNRPDERPQPCALQTEFLDSQLSKSKVELALAITRQDRPEGPGKDVADRLDRELKDFATAKINNPSADMQNFQKMIGKFCDGADKNKAMEELGESYSKLKVDMEKRAEKTYEELKAEGDKQPGRAGLEADYSNKLNTFFNKVDALPQAENSRVMDLLSWDAETESKAHHQEVVRQGLAGNKDLLSAYNSMEAASDKIDANKSPREKTLEAEHNQFIWDFRAMHPQVEKAYIRSTITG
jgi:hypothetical protein